MRWTERQVQYVLTRPGCLFDFRNYASVPNVKWGLGLDHEADLLCLSRAGVFHEIEIKCSLSDLRADAGKQHGHYSRLVPHLWFAISPDIESSVAVELIPDFAGLVLVRWVDGSKRSARTKVIRRPRPKRRNCRFDKPTDKEKSHFLRLGVMRMWSDKRKWIVESEFENGGNV